MADSVSAGVSATKNFVKNHWLAFLVTAFVVVALALAYDHKNNGALSSRIAGLPLIGRLFA